MSSLKIVKNRNELFYTNNDTLFTTTSPVSNAIGKFKVGDVVTESDNVSINEVTNSYK